MARRSLGGVNRPQSTWRLPEVARRNTRVHFIQSLKERIAREVGYGQGASAADLVKSMHAEHW